MMTTKLRFAEETSLPSHERKKNLREYMKKRRAENCNRDGKEMRLIGNLLQMLFNQTKGTGVGRKFFIYLSFALEAPTDKLIARLKSMGHTIYCPRLEEGKMVAVLHGEEFALSAYGMYEPLGDAYDGDVDFIILPFLAVDEDGNRLGYGKGYYDHYLKASKGVRIAYGYDFQILSAVPTEDWDEKVDWIVTDEKIIEVGRKK